MTKSKCLSIIKDFLADVSEISEKNELLETTQLAIWLKAFDKESYDVKAPSVGWKKSYPWYT